MSLDNRVVTKRSARGRIAFAGCAAIGLLAVSIGLLLILAKPEPNRVRRALAAAIDPAANPCASADDVDWSPTSFPQVPGGFADLAVERAAIICNDVGPSTYYFRFASHGSLQRALKAFPGVRVCALDDAVFTGNHMDFAADPSSPRPFEATCARLHGRVLGA